MRQDVYKRQRQRRSSWRSRERVVEAQVGELKARPSVSPLVRNAIALMASSMGSAGIGIVFWGVAAHLVSVENLGRASAELSAMSLLASLASLSIGSTFIRFLPVSGDRTRQLVARSYGCLLYTSLHEQHHRLIETVGTCRGGVRDGGPWRAVNKEGDGCRVPVDTVDVPLRRIH